LNFPGRILDVSRRALGNKCAGKLQSYNFPASTALLTEDLSKYNFTSCYFKFKIYNFFIRYRKVPSTFHNLFVRAFTLLHYYFIKKELTFLVAFYWAQSCVIFGCLYLIRWRVFRLVCELFLFSLFSASCKFFFS